MDDFRGTPPDKASYKVKLDDSDFESALLKEFGRDSLFCYRNRCPSVLCVSFRVEIASKVQKSVVQSGSFSINCRPAMICRLHCWLQGSGLYCCFFDISNVQGDAQLAKVSVRIPTSTDGTTAILKSQKLNLTSTGNSSNGAFLTVTKLWADDSLTSNSSLPLELRKSKMTGRRPSKRCCLRRTSLLA